MEKSKLIENLCTNLLKEKQYPFAEVCDLPNSSFSQSGIYAWFFPLNAFEKAICKVPLEGCSTKAGRYLFYIGISPSSIKSCRTLRQRLVENHCKGNARRSTLRKSIGCLLQKQLQLVPCLVSGRLSFTLESEEKLSAWMSRHSFITWMALDEPWKYECAFIEHFRPPLNIKHNTQHPFSATLSSIRCATEKAIKD